MDLNNKGRGKGGLKGNVKNTIKIKVFKKAVVDKSEKLISKYFWVFLWGFFVL